MLGPNAGPGAAGHGHLTVTVRWAGAGSSHCGSEMTSGWPWIDLIRFVAGVDFREIRMENEPFFQFSRCFARARASLPATARYRSRSLAHRHL